MNLKTTIVKNFTLFLSFILFIIAILFLNAGVNKTPMNTNCFLDCYGAGVVGILFFVSLTGIIIFFIPSKKKLPKILSFSFFLSSVIIAILFSKYFGECKRSHFDSTVGVICEDIPVNEEIDTKKSNNEWEACKKCTHLLAGFSFEYPNYLETTKEEKQYNYWQIIMESPDFSYKDKRNLDIASGFRLFITANPVTDKTFAEFKNWVDPKDPNRNRSGIVWVKKNSRKFFTQTLERTPYDGINDSESIFDYSLNTLYNPNLKISAHIIGTESNKEEMQKILDHFMETLE